MENVLKIEIRQPKENQGYFFSGESVVCRVSWKTACTVPCMCTYTVHVHECTRTVRMLVQVHVQHEHIRTLEAYMYCTCIILLFQMNL